jgi:hypothetical protein
MIRWLVNDELGKDVVGSGYDLMEIFFVICMERLKKTVEILTKDNWYAKIQKAILRDTLLWNLKVAYF